METFEVDHSHGNTDVPRKPCLNKYALCGAILASTNSILLGYDIGVMSGAVLYIRDNLKNHIKPSGDLGGFTKCVFIDRITGLRQDFRLDRPVLHYCSSSCHISNRCTVNGTRTFVPIPDGRKSSRWDRC